MVWLILALVAFLVSAICYIALIDAPRARFAGMFLAVGLALLTAGQLAENL